MGLPFVAGEDADGEGALAASNPWDVVKLLGETLPGICRVKATPRLATDVQKPNGGDAAAIILRGYTPAQVEIEITMWTAAQWKRLQSMVPSWWRRPNKTSDLQLASVTKKQAKEAKKTENLNLQIGAAAIEAAAVSIFHPALALLNINQVVVTEISAPEPGPQPQTIVVRMKCYEFIARSNVTTTTVTQGTKTSPINTTRDSAFDGDRAPENATRGQVPSDTDAEP